MMSERYEHVEKGVAEPSKWGFWAVAFAVVVLVLDANTPLPLLTVYQARFGFSTAMLSVVYAIYTAGVIAAVFLIGPASDLVGRKRVLLPALVTMTAGLLLGMFAADVWVLLASRLLQGIAIGAGTTTAIAALGELHPGSRDHGRIALTATVATVTGLAGGPLVAGSLAQFAPYPTVTPYLAALALVGIATLAIVFIPETVQHRKPFRLQRVTVSVPKSAAQAFYLATFVELTAYAVAGTFAGLGSSFARDLLNLQSHFAAGLVVALLFVCSAFAQLAVRQWPLKRAIRTGLFVLIVGLMLFAQSVYLRSAIAFFASAAILGAGHGLSYLGSQELTDRIAPPDRRAQIFSAFQLGLYAGATIPALVVGFATAQIGFAPATLYFAATIAGFATLGWLWTTLTRNTAVQSETILPTKETTMTTLTSPPAHARSKLSIASDSILLVADLQGGIADLKLTVPEPQLKKGVAALMKLAAIFDIPKIITVVPGADGKPSPLMAEVEAARGGQALMVRSTPNAFNDKEIRHAIETSGRKTLIITGVATEVAVQMPALTAAAEGYNVLVVVDACGGISERTEDAAFRRMTAAGAHTTSVPALIGELAGDFVEPRGQQAIGVLFELAGE